MQRATGFRCCVLAAAVGLLLATAWADEPDDGDEAARYRIKPRDLTGRILESATSAPASQPADPDRQAGPNGQTGPSDTPASPFESPAQARKDVLPGYLELSDGTVLPGLIYTTREKPWSVHEAESKSFRRIPPAIVQRIDAEVVWERDEPDWRWKEQGSDEKVYTGRTYPARMLRYCFTLVDGQKIAGTVQQPIYVRPDGGGEAVQFILHERQKGPLDAKLDRLVYVRHVVLGEQALERGRELAARRATTQPADPGGVK